MRRAFRKTKIRDKALIGQQMLERFDEASSQIRTAESALGSIHNGHSLQLSNDRVHQSMPRTRAQSMISRDQSPESNPDTGEESSSVHVYFERHKDQAESMLIEAYTKHHPGTLHMRRYRPLPSQKLCPVLIKISSLDRSTNITTICLNLQRIEMSRGRSCIAS